MNETREHRLIAAICLLLGLSVCLIGVGIIPYDPSKIHAPAWVILAGGGIFMLAGLALLFRSRPIVVNVLGNLIVIAFAAVGAWVALYGPSEQFSGGLPLVSDETNVGIARVFFGVGSILCLLMLIPGLRYLLKAIREQ